MPNGDYLPECYYCAHYNKDEDLKQCMKHDFVMPRYGGWILCRDWQLHNKYQDDSLHFGYVKDFLQKDEFLSLKPGMLYVGERYLKYRPYAPFEKLKFLIFIAEICLDNELGWYLTSSDLYKKYFPDIEATLTLVLDKKEYQFEVSKIERAKELRYGHPGLGEKSMIQNVTVRIKAIHCPSRPNLLYQWLDKYIDIQGLITDERTTIEEQTWGEHVLEHGISVYVEVRSENVCFLYPQQLWDFQKIFERDAKFGIPYLE